MMRHWWTLMILLSLAFAAAPATAEDNAQPSAVPWKRECAERRQNLDNTLVKVRAAAVAESGDKTVVCADITTMTNQAWLYCSCAADDEGTSKLMGCFNELKKPGEELKKKFSCP